MKFELILIRYGEIALKSKYIRNRFESILVNNIKVSLDIEKIKYKIIKEWGRIYLYTNSINRSKLVLEKIFGITSFSPSLEINSNIYDITNKSIEFSKKFLDKEKKFALRVSRTGNHNFNSREIAVNVGNEIVKNTQAKVDLTKPDIELFIEIRNKKTYLYTKKIRGVGGMPQGTQGKVLAVIDSLESILASWYLLRRGCKITFLNIDKSNKEKLEKFISEWYLNSKIINLEKKSDLIKLLNEKQNIMIFDAYVIGIILEENISKSISDIYKLKKNVNNLILYPLIALGKNEIINKCKRIGIKI